MRINYFLQAAEEVADRALELIAKDNVDYADSAIWMVTDPPNQSDYGETDTDPDQVGKLRLSKRE